MLKSVLFLVLLLSANLASAQTKTVSECAKDLSRSVFGIDEKKGKEFCKKNKQKVIDCAVEWYRGHKLGHEFEDAIDECAREE